jgi:tight adherence protein C
MHLLSLSLFLFTAFLFWRALLSASRNAAISHRLFNKTAQETLYDRAMTRLGAALLAHLGFLKSGERLARDAGLLEDGALARFIARVAAFAGLLALCAGLAFLRRGIVPAFLSGIIAVMAVAAGALLFLKWRRAGRCERIRHEMPFCLDIVTVMMKGGNNVEQCFRQLLASGAEACPETHRATAHLIADLDNGKPYAAAFDRWAQMLMLPTAATLSSLFQQSLLYGTEITPSLMRLSALMIDERLQNARLAAGRRLPQITIVMLLFLLPPVFVVLTAPAVSQLMLQMKGR